MKRSKPRALALLILVSLLASASRVWASQPYFTTLHPGQFQQIDQNLQINQASTADYKAHGANYMLTDHFNPGRRH